MTQTQYDYQATEEKKRLVREKFERLLDEGREQAVDTLQRIELERPQDLLAHTDAMKFKPSESNDGIVIDIGKNGKVQSMSMHRHALDQAVEKSDVIGTTTARKLLDVKQPWATKLLAHNLNESYQHIDRSRVLVRSVGGTVKGVLSDKYRRLDSGPIFESFVKSMQTFGGVPVHGRMYDTKTTLTMALTTIFDPVPSDPKGMCIAGATLGNSDYGDGALFLRLFFKRLICMNGAMRDDAFRQVHLGRRLSDDFTYSEETYQLDTRTSISAMGDILRGLMDPTKINEEMALIRRSAETQVDVARLFASLRSGGSITKGEEKALVAVYNTPDVEMLPPGNSLWRASNALSLFAQDSSLTPERALDMQVMAGSVLNRAMAAAA